MLPRLRKILSLAGASTTAISLLAGLDPSALRLIVTGQRTDPRVSTVSALARVLGCSLDWLVDGKGREPGAETVRRAVAKARQDAESPAPEAA